MTNRFLLLSSVFLLGSCAYAIDTHTQDIKIETPGARGSVCYMYVNKLRYRIHPPQTVNIDNSKEDLVVDCFAPGNRRKKVIIEPHLADHFALNALNGGAGALWDSASGAMFKYPAVVEVDFSEAAVKPESLPAQNAPDIKQPEEYDLEEFRPGSPRMNEDKGQVTYELQRRESGRSVDNAATYVDDQFSFETTGEATGGKADLDVVNTLIQSMDPATATEQTGDSYNPPIDVTTTGAEPQSSPSSITVEESSAPVAPATDMYGPTNLLPTE